MFISKPNFLSKRMLSELFFGDKEDIVFMHSFQCLVPSNVMCRLWSIYSVNLLCKAKEPSILYVIRCDVIVIVSSFTVITEAMKVFNAQVQTLERTKNKG